MHAIMPPTQNTEESIQKQVDIRLINNHQHNEGGKKNQQSSAINFVDGDEIENDDGIDGEDSQGDDDQHDVQY